MLLAVQDPVMVRFVDEPVTGTTVADVLLGAVGLTGALIVGALLLGLALGGILIGLKKVRERYNLEAVPDSESLKIT